MSDSNGVLRITYEDVAEANQLSLQCPICASPVENHAGAPALTPVACNQCNTLYHQACWEGSGGKCAILGCGHTACHRYGSRQAPVLTIRPSDVPSEAQVAQMEMRRLKSAEKARPSQRQQPQPRPVTRGFWAQLLENIRRAFGLTR